MIAFKSTPEMKTKINPENRGGGQTSYKVVRTETRKVR